MSTNQAAGGAPAAPLNPARRPQRLYAKTQIAMNIVDEKLKQATKIPEWLSAEQLKDFLKTVRSIIRD